MVSGVAGWLDGLRHKHRFLLDGRCFFALQETHSWKVTEMEVETCNVDVCD